MRVIRKANEIDAYEVSYLLHTWDLRGYEGLPEKAAAGFDEGVLDFPSGFLGRSAPEFIEVCTKNNGLMLAKHGEYLIRDEHGVWWPVDRDEFRQKFEIITTQRKAQA